MARLPRLVVPNHPLHIMHRGNNRQAIFETDDDLMRIKEDLTVSLAKSHCQLHAYVIMTNHLHLLVTPTDKEQLSVFMQSLTNRYARYFNTTRKRTGTIWEGRFKSCLVDSEAYLFTLYKYIEMNPIKASLVDDIADYRWSSYPHNALAQIDELITEHELYAALGPDNQQRAERYRQLFKEIELEKQTSEITAATVRGEVYGRDTFHKEISTEVNRATKLTSHGGDRRSNDYKNQAGRPLEWTP